ncbi:MAG: leucine-rich repeat domain-containing protein [Rhodothermaceae bacterium]|nr:leucine-rich repeat domain-containing protein [Rhodothermaceae bacterium]
MSLLCLLLFSLLSFPTQTVAQVTPFPGCDVQTQIPEEECNALRIFFERTNGEFWLNRGGWMRAGQACEWMGVVCETGPWPRNVRKIILIDNDIAGTIPGELSFLTELEELVIENTATAGYFNVVGGFLPDGLKDLDNLKILRIRGHEITGPVPSEWTKFKNLEILDLGNNMLTGRIPDAIGNITSLKEIDLSSNQLIGTIPQSISNLTNLENLNLGSNDFFGEIPPQIGQLSELSILDLRENNFTGPIPSSLGTLPKLISLTLRDNELSGPPPPSVIKLASEISICSMTEQSTQFCIPDAPIYRIDGQDNICGVPLDATCSFCSSTLTAGHASCGTLESIFYKTEGINWADQSGWLSAPDPCSWHGLECTDGQVTTLSLPDNNLNGDIPEEIGNLTGLDTLNLSGNALAGPIPLSVALLQNSTNSCNLASNDASLCIPDDPDYAAITTDAICGLPLTFSCSSAGSPGSFSSIESHISNGINQLTWRATRRIPDAYFEVERKENGVYTVIGRVESPHTPDDPQLYSYTLPELRSGIHTFRVHLTTSTGASLYSAEIDIISSGNNYLLEPPYPNPTVGPATLRFVIEEQQPVQLTLYDITGRELKVLYSGNPEVNLIQEITIQAGDVASGIYFVRLEGDSFSTSQTLFIQK